ncbi:MAG: TIGR02677 family protein [Acidimicrobiales bacterium]
MTTTTTTPGRLRAFAYLTAEKAALYRAVMRSFTLAKERFALHLRPVEVLASLQGQDLAEPVEQAGVDAALAQLRDWGNLDADQDTAEVATVEEFYRPRFLYQLTAAGEAAERAVALYEEAVAQPGELQAAALTDIRELLGELALTAAGPDPDPGKVHRTLRSLRARFDELTAKAQAFIGSLQRAIDLHGVEVVAFLAYKDTLIDYLERFIGELVVAQADIAGAIARVEAAGVDRLLHLAAERDLADALAATEADRAHARTAWADRWSGLRHWFIGTPDAPCQADVLRSRARSAIPALLAAVAGINDRRVTRSDRAADLRTLAHWFAQADRDSDAHRLWRAAFALTPSRHLGVDDTSLDERAAAPVPAATSWLHAPPLRISPRLRRTGHHLPRGRPPSVIDRSAAKAALAALAAEESAQVAAARDRLATGRPTRLAELGHLDPDAFALFLDLLGQALAGKAGPGDAVEAVSADGTVSVTLAPTGDGARATVRTAAGSLSGPDHWLTVTDLLAGGPGATSWAGGGRAEDAEPVPAEVSA